MGSIPTLTVSASYRPDCLVEVDPWEDLNGAKLYTTCNGLGNYIRCMYCYVAKPGLTCYEAMSCGKKDLLTLLGYTCVYRLGVVF